MDKKNRQRKRRGVLAVKITTKERLKYGGKILESNHYIMMQRSKRIESRKIY
jgi:hypothetical protein